MHVAPQAVVSTMVDIQSKCNKLIILSAEHSTEIPEERATASMKHRIGTHFADGRASLS